MTSATCIITNCRRPAPSGEPFCSAHRDRPAKPFVLVKARSGIEAMHAHNDVFPGDIVQTAVSNLAWEAMKMAFAGFESRVTTAITAAFARDMDYLILWADPPHVDGWEIVSHFHGIEVVRGSMKPEECPQGQMLFSLDKWEVDKAGKVVSR